MSDTFSRCLGRKKDNYKRRGGPVWPPAKGENMKRIFDQIIQAGIVTADCQKSAALFHDVYGIGPWKFYDLDDYMSAVCTALNVQFELIQPEKDGPMTELLEKRGEAAVFDLGFSAAEDYDGAKEFLISKGAEIREYVFSDSAKTAFFDTYSDLGMSVKLSSDDSFAYPEDKMCGCYPQDMSCPSVKIYSRVGHFCLAADPVMDYVKKYNDEYAFGPWIIVDLNEGPIIDRKVHGELRPHRTVATNCFMCDVNFEINGDEDGNSSYGEFVRKNGAGIHHVMMELCCDPGDYLDFLTKERGFEVLQQGTMKTSGDSYYYVGSSKELGFNLETFSKFPDPSDPPEFGPPLLGTYPEKI